METELNGVRAFGLKSNLGISEKHVVGFVCWTNIPCLACRFKCLIEGFVPNLPIIIYETFFGNFIFAQRIFLFYKKK
jgi:hypothetical protein